MFARVIQTAQASAAHTARTAALGLAGGILLAVGAGFLTLAAWLTLLTVTTALTAAVILGCFFMGAGIMTLVIVSGRKKSPQTSGTKPPHDPKDEEDIMNQVIMTFLAGITAGRKARS